ILISEAKRLEAESIALFVAEHIVKEEINQSTWRFFAWELMTANRAAADGTNTSMARAELAGMCAVIREGRRPMFELGRVFGPQYTRHRIDSLRELLTAMVEAEKYQRWENDINALLLDLHKIDNSF
ncbi:MAG: hypothetical protein OIF58_08840, partial [Cohaesibacter sp.]|nr:hypothetical protein [Cohaesibacter sp.]